jgi:hypothetical protein
VGFQQSWSWIEGRGGIVIIPPLVFLPAALFSGCARTEEHASRFSFTRAAFPRCSSVMSQKTRSTHERDFSEEVLVTTCSLCVFSYNFFQNVFRWYKTLFWTCTAGTICVWSCHVSVHGQVVFADKSLLNWRFRVRPQSLFPSPLVSFPSPLLSSQP